MLKKVAVLGGGSGSHTMAADLALKGLEVNSGKEVDNELQGG